MVNSPGAEANVGGIVPSISLGYGGVFAEAILLPNKLIHPTFGALFGGGGAGYNFEQADVEDQSTAIFVVDSFVGVELNLTTFMRLEVGGDYRRVFGSDLPKLPNGDLSSFGGHVALKFGAF